MQVYRLNIISNTQVSDRYWHMVVDASEINEEINPGQFFNLKCSDEDYPFLRRPFSIYRINKDEKTIEFLYLIKGLGTSYLTKMKKGGLIDIFGPLGQGFVLKKEWSTILLLARGVGIATLAALAQEATQRDIKCIAILSARSNNDLLATETLQSLGAEVYKVTEEESTSDVNNVKLIIEEIFKTNGIKAGFTCGSNRLAKLMQEVMREKSIPAQIALEEHMGCSMGVCYACVCNVEVENKVQPVRVCVDGPAFNLDKVVLE